MPFDMEALAAGMNEEIKRQNVVLEAYVKRVKALEAALRPFVACISYEMVGTHHVCSLDRNKATPSDYHHAEMALFRSENMP